MPVNSPDVKEGASPAGAVQEKGPPAGLLRRLVQGAVGVALLGGLLWLLLRKIEEALTKELEKVTAPETA